MPHWQHFNHFCYNPACVWALIQQEFVVEPTGQKNSSQKNTDRSSSWAMASEGMQLAVTLLLFLGLGIWWDSRKGTSPTFTLIGAVVGIGIGLYGFLHRFLKKP